MCTKHNNNINIKHNYPNMMDFTNYCSDTSLNPVGCNSFFLTNTALITVTTSATVSVLSSLTILYVVYRSERQFRSVYHRIITGIAFFDLISSLAIALTTIPMPKDVIYPFEGQRVYGTVETCEAQGFMITFGFLGSLCMSCGLSIFYASIIHFRMKDRKLRRCLEPIIHGFAWFTSLTVAIILLVMDLYNPSMYESWCAFSDYPNHCSSKSICIRGKEYWSKRGLFSIGVFTLLSVGAAIIIACMFLIILGNWKHDEYFHSSEPLEVQDVQDTQEAQLDSLSPPFARTSLALIRREQTSIRRSVHESKENDTWPAMRKTLMSQALMYIIAFIMTWIFALLRIVTDVNTSGIRAIDFLYCIFFPLQGFFNGLIFVYHKIHNIRRHTPSMSFGSALSFVFTRTREMPEAQISGLSMLSSRNFRRQVVRNDENVSHKSHSEAEDASKDVQMSTISDEGSPFALSDEISFMFDLSIGDTSSRRHAINNNSSRPQPNSSNSIDAENELSTIDNDASTVKASSRWTSL